MSREEVESDYGWYEKREKEIMKITGKIESITAQPRKDQTGNWWLVTINANGTPISMSCFEWSAITDVKIGDNVEAEATQTTKTIGDTTKTYTNLKSIVKVTDVNADISEQQTLTAETPEWAKADPQAEIRRSVALKCAVAFEATNQKASRDTVVDLARFFVHYLKDDLSEDNE